ncbi:MAG: TatD family hydrolase [Candidatus Kariarchaeaceae archaeon]
MEHIELVDAHAHLILPWFEASELEEIMKRAFENKVKWVVNCASEPENYQEVLDGLKIKGLYSSLGLQPTIATSENLSLLRQIIENLTNKEQMKNLALGEVGLDYYWVKEEKERANQAVIFEKTLELAHEYNYPVVIHSRDAEKESVDILEKKAQTPVLMHSFAGDEVQIKRVIDNGWVISVPTSVVYRKKAQRIAEKIPLENLVLETDAPFLGPFPRKKGEKHTRNEPANIVYSLNYFAEKRQISKLEIAKRTTANAIKFYKF